MMQALPTHTLVLAGTASQAAAWMREHNLSPANIRYVASASTITGGQMDEKFVVTGTFWDRHDAIQIWERLMELQTVRAKAPDHIEPYLEHNMRLKVPVMPPTPVIVPPTPAKPLEAPKAPKTFKHIKEPPPPKKRFKKIRDC